MSNIVEQIVDAFETEVASILGGTYKELRYKYDIEQNNFNTNDKRYGVRPLFGETVSGVLCHYTMDQEFEVTITRRFTNKYNDDSLQTAVLETADKFDDIFKSIKSSKLGIPSIVILVSGFTMDEPEIFDENNVVALRANFTVRYRQKLT